MEPCLFFILGWISTLTGVFLGGWLVYRTKRDAYEPMFTSSKGDAFNIEDDFALVGDPADNKLPPSTAKANTKFAEQFAESIAKKVTGDAQ